MNKEVEVNKKQEILVVSATRADEETFWRSTALGLSLKPLLERCPQITINIAFENSKGLPEVYNEVIGSAGLDAALLFIHDDVWIDEKEFCQSIFSGLDQYDVIGVAGNRRYLAGQPSWAFIDEAFTWDEKSNLSGRVAHGQGPQGDVSDYGAVPADCELLDGVLLATTKRKLDESGLLFDPIFKFHFYDMDFSKQARSLGLKLGTWPIAITHQSGGSFGSPEWRAAYELFLKKWESAPQENAMDPSSLMLSNAAEPIFRQALTFHKANQLELAEKWYKTILEVAPNHPDASHNLGLIEMAKIGACAALPRFEVAVSMMPDCEQYWVSYINALLKCGAVDTAESAFEWGQKYGLKEETSKVLRACHAKGSLFEVKHEAASYMMR